VKAVVVNDAVLHEPEAGGDEVGQNHVHYTAHTKARFMLQFKNGVYSSTRSLADPDPDESGTSSAVWIRALPFFTKKLLLYAIFCIEAKKCVEKSW